MEVIDGVSSTTCLVDPLPKMFAIDTGAQMEINKTNIYIYIHSRTFELYRNFADIKFANSLNIIIVKLTEMNNHISKPTGPIPTDVTVRGMGCFTGGKFPAYEISKNVTVV